MDNEELLQDGECPRLALNVHTGPHSVADKATITDGDLAWMEAVCRLAPAAGIDSVELDAAQALTLVAALREARETLEPFAEAVTRMRRAEGKSVALISTGADGHFGYLPIERFRRAARILKETDG